MSDLKKNQTYIRVFYNKIVTKLNSNNTLVERSRNYRFFLNKALMNLKKLTTWLVIILISVKF